MWSEQAGIVSTQPINYIYIQPINYIYILYTTPFLLETFALDTSRSLLVLITEIPGNLCKNPPHAWFDYQ